VDDFAYLFRDSAHAWLVGGGDARFYRYERHYRDARVAEADGFDLEKFNEEFVNGKQRKSLRAGRLLSHPAVVKFGLACFMIWGAAQFVPTMATSNPEGTGFAIAAAFLGLRIFHRKSRG
jgi:hypothetical protein